MVSNAPKVILSLCARLHKSKLFVAKKISQQEHAEPREQKPWEDRLLPEKHELFQPWLCGCIQPDEGYYTLAISASDSLNYITITRI